MTFSEYLAYRWEDLLLLSIQHVQVVLIAVAIATVVAVLVGVLVHGHAVPRQLVLTVTATMLTIPSFALFGLLIPLLGLGLLPTISALSFYAIFPILRNVITGLESVPAEVEEAARGMGLSVRRRLYVVRVPLAWPVLLNGIRVATIMCVGIAAIAAAVNGPGLGELDLRGPGTNRRCERPQLHADRGHRRRDRGTAARPPVRSDLPTHDLARHP